MDHHLQIALARTRVADLEKAAATRLDLARTYHKGVRRLSHRLIIIARVAGAVRTSP